MRTILTFKTTPGDSLDWCVREAIKVSIREGREVVLVHNKNEYRVDTEHLVRLVMADIEKLKRAQAEVEEIEESLQKATEQETAKQVTKMKIMNMAAGRRFRMGTTPCMKVYGLGPAGHVSLVTGSINYASVQPEDEFVMEDR